ncbi:MAG TPA: GAF domain-containing protein [Desulfuromonadales bacterium]|nr:GAF domain-containing protein [Desulfuromonadales bacterium]
MGTVATSDLSSATEASDPSKIKPTHIVGIGASAGGLSALEQFFDNMPPDTGMAFVVIQHLSPDFKSLMDDLLSRHTSMPIHRVTNGIELTPDNIYLIPPKTHMTVSKEKLYLTEKVINPHTLELPIDIFFNSLAEDAGDRAVGVVLSGTGSDGSKGIISINKNGGLVVIQSPESARFDGMPRNAIATGVCDFILAPNRIPRILVEYSISPLAVRTRMHHELEIFEDEGEYAGIFALLRRSYNLDFSKYKDSTVGRRIRRRMDFRQIPEVSDYAAIMSGDPGELDLLYKDLLIGVTEFFRDTQAFQFLEQEVIPRLFANLHRGEDLRVWSAACATGEEAYSLAILLDEKAAEIGFVGKITVFATDVHKTSLDFAAQGVYDRAKLTNVSPKRMNSYFKKEGNDLFRVTSELRKLVVFAPHNLLSDPPFTRLDLVCCRNLLIYFQTEVQERVISLFHFALKIDGTLFLGSSEGLGPFIGEFEVIANQHKMFRKIRDLKLALNIETNRLDRKEPHIQATVFPPGVSRMVSIERQILADYDTLLRRHMPPGVLINENRQIIHYFGNVAEYLKMPEGRTENNILSLAEDNLHIALSTSLQRADTTRQLVVTRNVRIKRGDGEYLIDLYVSPLPDDKNHTTHYHVYFERIRPTEFPLAPDQPEDVDATNFDVDDHFRQHVADLEMELQSTRESLQTTVEELQTSNEELQATNEELLASNEELQSTNEELHSVNEELYSVNSEFERKNIELKQLNNDHENLLASTDIGTVFLDRQLRIRKYNPAIEAFFKLLPQDIGRPIDHIAYHLSQQEEMLADISRVLQNGRAVEQEEETKDNKWLLKRIMPFRTETGQIEGVVITFTDITVIKTAERKVIRFNEELEQKVAERTEELQREIAVRKNAEDQLAEARDHYLNILAEAPALIWRANTDALCDWFNSTWLAFTGRSMEQEYGNGWVEGVHPDDLKRCITIWQDSFAQRVPFEMEYRLRRFDGEYRWLLDIGRPNHTDSRFVGYIGYCFDITERKQSEFDLAGNKKRLESLVKVSQNPTRNIQALLDCALDEAIELTGSKIGYVYNYSEETQEFTLNSWSKEVMKECSITAPMTCYALHKTGIWGEVVRQRIPLIMNDFQAFHPLKKGYPEGHAPLFRYLSIPVFDLEKIVAVVAVANKESDYTQTDTLQLTLLMDSVWRMAERIRSDEEKKIFEQQLHQIQRLESLGVLAGGIAHDFNNIMAIIIGYCALIKLDLKSAEKKIPEIEKAADRAAGLCRQMLAYAGKATLTQTTVNMKEIVEEMIRMLKATIPQNVTINAIISSESASITGDASQIRQIVMNLIINAAEAIHEAQGTVHVSLAHTEINENQREKDYLGKRIPVGEYLCLKVTDDGCGMNDETKNRIFEPFYTTKFTGRGLGMSSVLGIITAHRGAIQLASKPGNGTTFTVYLPIHHGEAASNRPVLAITSERWQGSGTVLLVEDEEEVRLIAAALLKKLGYTVIAASDGKGALELYRENTTDISLVVTDMGMPGMDGGELFRELKTLKPELPIIISSGFGDVDVTAKIAHEDIAALINKPYRFDMLREVLQRVENVS